MYYKERIVQKEKTVKKRVTVLLGSNMTSTDKIKSLLIGKSAKPRCFKGIKTYPLIIMNQIKKRG